MARWIKRRLIINSETEGNPGPGEGDVVHSETDSELEVRELEGIPDRTNHVQMADEVMQVLSQSERAAHIVYLKLSKTYAG